MGTARAALFFLLALRLLAPATTPEALFVVVGDQHSAYERTAQLVAAVDRLKAKHPGLPMAILLDGDTLESGNVVARRSRGIVDFAMFSALATRAPTVVNLGNHDTEFYGLAETVARIEATGAKVVTNLTNPTTGRPAASPSIPLTLGANRAIVIGVATEDLSTYPEAVRPSLGVADPVAWARANFPALLSAAPVRIVLSHAGLNADRGMLPLVPDGTLFAGAHDHLRFLQAFGRTVYVHSGSWNAFMTLAWLRHDTSGVPRWDVEQIPIPSEPSDPRLATLIRDTKARYLAPEDRAVVAHLPAALAPADAARAVAGALRRGAGADAAFIGNTTFGDGLPSGDITRAAFDACVRFDGEIFVAAVNGARLRRLLTTANQGVETTFERRSGEFNVASGPATVDQAKIYRIVTTDWGAKHSARYFGEPAIEWHEQAGATLKRIVLREFSGRR
ncbi:MAG TPA: 5'-nucleotidase C-terminal domain-containing protein [Vicinamibacterales bacterium]|nr:5'-nucleotidase C-terminal domain-containing protein [Vicinamibacterales bacterium]